MNGRREEEEALAKLAAVNTSILELDAALAETSAAVVHGSPDADGDAESDALLAEISQLEADVHAKELGTKGAPPHERLIEEYGLAHRALIAALRRNSKLKGLLAELGDPGRLASKQEALTRKTAEQNELTSEILAIERAIKKVEQQLAAAAASRERDADSATNEARKLQAEAARLAQAASAAEAELEQLRAQLQAAQADLTIGVRLTDGLADALRARVAELEQGEPLLALSARAQQPLSEGALASGGEDGGGEDIAQRLLEARGEGLVSELHALQRRHARIAAELHRRRALLETERAAAAKLQARAAAAAQAAACAAPASPPAAGAPRAGLEPSASALGEKANSGL